MIGAGFPHRIMNRLWKLRITEFWLQKGIVITMEILLLGGGLLIIIFAVVVSVVSSVVSAIAADQDDAED